MFVLLVFSVEGLLRELEGGGRTSEAEIRSFGSTRLLVFSGDFSGDESSD